MRFPLLALFVVSQCCAATYYIAASGADTANGTSKGTPWLHAPGMTGCSDVCAATTPAAGDSFIFRGGDTWHRETGSPVGLPWYWQWSGTSGSRISIGVDKTWYAGGSWARPILTDDNPITTTPPASCTYDDSLVTSALRIWASYVTLDNFDFQGYCWNTSTWGSNYLNNSGDGIVVSHNYFHGWSHKNDNTLGDYQYWVVGQATNQGTQFIGNLFDGTDSSPHSGFGIYVDCGELSGNIFRHMTNGAVCNNAHSVHDNLFEYMTYTYDTTGNTHTNVLELNASASSDNYYYNNLVRHVETGGQGIIGFWLKTGTATSTDWVYNNVIYDMPSGNCFLYGQNVDGATGNTVNFLNNTFDQCPITFSGNSSDHPYKGTFNVENNHFIGYSAQNLAATWSNGTGTYAGTATVTDLGGNVYQSEAVANGQGYTASNDYQPASAGNATVGAGTNLTASCSSQAPLCTDTSSGQTRTSVARPSSAAWDAGAYQYVPPPQGITRGGPVTFGGPVRIN